MYTLIWQSVMWRPGKMRFLIGMKNPLPTQPAASFPGRAGYQENKRGAEPPHRIVNRRET
jgi:hypothetical protein